MTILRCYDKDALMNLNGHANPVALFNTLTEKYYDLKGNPIVCHNKEPEPQRGKEIVASIQSKDNKLTLDLFMKNFSQQSQDKDKSLSTSTKRTSNNNGRFTLDTLYNGMNKASSKTYLIPKERKDVNFIIK